MKTDAVKYGAVIYMPWMLHAMKADAVKCGAMIYMLFFTCRRLHAAYSGTHLRHADI